MSSTSMAAGREEIIYFAAARAIVNGLLLSQVLAEVFRGRPEDLHTLEERFTSLGANSRWSLDAMAADVNARIGTHVSLALSEIFRDAKAEPERLGAATNSTPEEAKGAAPDR